MFATVFKYILSCFPKNHQSSLLLNNTQSFQANIRHLIKAIYVLQISIVF